MSTYTLKMSNELRSQVIDDVYNATMVAIRNGVPMYILEDFIEYYEAQEMYEECAGVIKAIHTYKEAIKK